MSSYALPRLDLEFPRPFNIERMLGDFVLGEGLRALVAFTRNQPGVLHRISKVIAERGLNIAYLSIPFIERERAVIFLVLEVGEREDDYYAALRELSKLEDVEEVREVECISPSICTGSMFFPLTAATTGGERLIVFRVSAFQALLGVLRAHVDGLAPLLLYSQGESYGANVAETVRRLFPRASLEVIVKIVAEGYRSLGLGDVEYIRSIVAEDGRVLGYMVSIRDNWEAVIGAPACDMTRGIIAGVLRGLLGVAFNVVEERHASEGRCVFRVEPY